MTGRGKSPKVAPFLLLGHKIGTKRDIETWFAGNNFAEEVNVIRAVKKKLWKFVSTHLFFAQRKKVF